MRALQRVVVALFVALASVSLAAQEQLPPGFRTFTPGDRTEQLPATPLVFYAYAFVWVALLTYVFFLWQRLKKLEQELSGVQAKLATGRRP